MYFIVLLVGPIPQRRRLFVHKAVDDFSFVHSLRGFSLFKSKTLINYIKVYHFQRWVNVSYKCVLIDKLLIIVLISICYLIIMYINRQIYFLILTSTTWYLKLEMAQDIQLLLFHGNHFFSFNIYQIFSHVMQKMFSLNQKHIMKKYP